VWLRALPRDLTLRLWAALAGGDLPPVYQITQTYDVWWQE
jgi:hypothetical protein